MALSIPISTIVNVQIKLQARSITTVGFGIPLILGVNAAFGGGERIREYFSIDDVLVDFASSSAEYKAANEIFSQNPSVESLKIGVEGARVAQIQTLVFSANMITANDIDGTVDGVALTQVPFNTSNAQTLTDLATALAATPGIATAVSDGVHTITITAQNAGVPVVLSGFTVTGGASQATVAITTTTPNHGIADDLFEISNQDDDWYGLIWTERGQAYVQEAASAVESLLKIFVTCSSDADILDPVSTTDIAAVLFGKKYNRTVLIYNATSTDFADAAWMGEMLPFDPGSATWKFKTLVGITADKLTPAEFNAAKNKNCNVYVTIAGVDMTSEGVSVSGIFTDLIVGIDWLQATMEERIFARLVNLPKIPFTDAGIAVIKNQIWSVLRLAIGRDVIAEDPKPDVFAPNAVDVDPNDRANRLLKGVTFNARMAGAIHKVIVQGTVTV